MTIRIAHVSLRNLRSYRSADLSFGPGTTLLTGDIGSGKTSLLFAMEMALFGFAEVDPGYLIRHGARDAEVSLTLTDGDRRWELRRRFVRRTRKGRDTFEPAENSWAVDGQRTSYSATELRRKTIEILGFPDSPNPRAHSDVWRWAVYLAQERMRDVLDPDEEARMETVRKALGVEQYRLAGENAHGLARSLQDQAAQLNDQASRLRGIEEEAVHWRQQEQSARQGLLQLEHRESQLRKTLQVARQTLDEAERRRREMEAFRQTLVQQERFAAELEKSLALDHRALVTAQERMTRLVADRDREADALSNEASAPDVLESLRNRRTDLLRQLGELEGLRGQSAILSEQKESWAERERELEAHRSSTLDELARTAADRDQLMKTAPTTEPVPRDPRPADQLSKERTGLEAARQSADRRLTTAKTELRELEELVQDGVCPRCHRPVKAEEFATHREEQRHLVRQLGHELQEATERLETLERRIQDRADYERLHDRWLDLESRRVDLDRRIGPLQTRATEVDGLRAQLKAEWETLEAREHDLRERLAAYEPVREDQTRVDDAIAAAEERVRHVAARRERLAAIEQQIPELEADLSVRTRNQEERRATLEETRHQLEIGRLRLGESGTVEEGWLQARRNADEAAAAVESVLRELSDPRGKIAEAEARLDEIARRQRERETLDRKAAQFAGVAAWLEHQFRTAMGELERGRLQQGRHQFERRFAQYFAALVEDPSLSARVDETFAPWVDIAGQSTPAEALSGGERTALALAYRLALGRMVREAGRLALETLILDEPTDGFSQEQTLRMGDLLEELGLPQVILVSHERQLEGIADRVIRVRKSGGLSSIEEVASGPEPAETSPPGSATPRPTPSPRRRKIRRLTDLDSSAEVPR